MAKVAIEDLYRSNKLHRSPMRMVVAACLHEVSFALILGFRIPKKDTTGMQKKDAEELEQSN
jgi:hypothetical protein